MKGAMGAKGALLGAALLVFSVASLARAEVIQKGPVRVSFDGRISPQALPRQRSAPVRVALETRIRSTDSGPPPQLRRVSIAINRYGRFSSRGLPVCALRDIQPSTTTAALEACGDAVVGQGRFSAKVLLNQQAPFPAAGRVYAFNGRLHGKPAILAHVYGTDPVPTSFTLPFTLRRTRGTFGTVLEAELPEVTGNAGHITGLSLKLGRDFSFHGRRHSFISASCPAPKGFSGAVFPLARASFGFAKQAVALKLTRNCRVRG